MKADKVMLFSGCILIVLLAVLIVWQADVLGVSAAKLEEDARENQEIENGWEVAQDINDDMCAMLFYDKERDDCTYSIYLSKGGISYGYFFRQGGFDPYMAESVKGVVFEDKGIALLSMNENKVCRIVTDNSVTEKVIQVDPTEPFVVLLPIDCGEIVMYDDQDNVVTMYDTFTGA